MHDVTPNVSARIRTLDTIVSDSVAGRRFTLLLTSLFGGSALIVAVLGLYGMLAFLVTQRRHEFGVRIALGAQRADVQRLILNQAGRLIVVGLTVGISAALAASRTLRTQLFDVGATDPATYIMAAAVLAIAGLVAAELPAVRATRVDPASVLRGEG
jgi:putative ABC transport system permease protein